MNDSPHDPARRQLFAAALIPGLEKLLEPLARKPNSYDEWFAAIEIDDATRCQQLLQRGFDPNTIEPERLDTALILSVRYRAWKVFTLLLKHPQIQLDARSRNGDTALMIAAFTGETKAALALIDQGAEINRPGWTALHYASAVGNTSVIKKLIDHSAYIDAESPNKTTPLMMAARAGHLPSVKLLLEEGADVLAKNELGLNAIDFANSQNHTSIVQLLDRYSKEALLKDNAQKPPGSTDAENLQQSSEETTDDSSSSNSQNEEQK